MSDVNHHRPLEQPEIADRTPQKAYNRVILEYQYGSFMNTEKTVSDVNHHRPPEIADRTPQID